ncbi:hypothetical protein [Paraburkholderia sp. 32]|uniref:hypothetical protein n=1 Tax=Paraburkholderia sp. 32 TaxID=2991057 RepID=UPI003D1CB692
MPKIAGPVFQEMRKCTNDLTKCLSLEQECRLRYQIAKKGEVICAFEDAVFRGSFGFHGDSATENGLEIQKFAENPHKNSNLKSYFQVFPVF